MNKNIQDVQFHFNSILFALCNKALFKHFIE